MCNIYQKLFDISRRILYYRFCKFAKNFNVVNKSIKTKNTKKLSCAKLKYRFVSMNITVYLVLFGCYIFVSGTIISSSVIFSRPPDIPGPGRGRWEGVCQGTPRRNTSSWESTSWITYYPGGDGKDRNIQASNLGV